MVRPKMLLLGFAVMMMNSHITLSETFDNQYYCPDYHPQSTLDLDQIMGVWYIIEIIHHKREEGMVQGAVTLRACPTVHLGRESRSDFRLIWTEPSATLYYKIRLENPNSPGFWISSGPHNESYVPASFFTHFTGTIQVMKAVSNHMALTFCTTQNDRSLFSVVLSREKGLSRLDIRGVNNMLQRRGLDLLLMKYTCNGSSKLNSVFLYLLLIIAWRCFF